MDFDTIRPVISGLIGAAIAGWLAAKWSQRLPHAKNSRKQRALVEEQGLVLRWANIGAGLGVGIGLLLYVGGFLDQHDWRGLGLCLGLTALLPMMVIAVGNLRGGPQAIKNGFLAFAVVQKTPAKLLFPLIGLMIAAGVWAALAFVPKDSNPKEPATRPTSNSEGGDKP